MTRTYKRVNYTAIEDESILYRPSQVYMDLRLKKFDKDMTKMYAYFLTFGLAAVLIAWITY